MQKNDSIIITLLIVIIIILGYLAFLKEKAPTQQQFDTTKIVDEKPTPIPYREEQKPDVQPTSPYPEFIGNLIKTMSTGQIVKFTYNGNIYYSVMTNFAIGTGATIYDKNGNMFGSCNASTGPQYDHEYCHNWMNVTEIWSKNKPSWMQ